MSDYDDKHWHLDKRINISHIAGTIGLLVSVMIWGSSVETRLALGEQGDEQQTALLQDIKDEQKELNRNFDKFLGQHYQDKVSHD